MALKQYKNAEEAEKDFLEAKEKFIHVLDSVSACGYFIAGAGHVRAVGLNATKNLVFKEKDKESSFAFEAPKGKGV